MSRSTVVTSTTSLVLIKDTTIKNYIYLPRIDSSNFTVTIRDTTGSSNIETNPVIISTLSPAVFIDDTSQYYLNKPYGLVNIALRNSTTWQVLHTSGLDPSNSAANAYNLYVSTSYFTLQSTNTKRVSTLYAESATTPNQIVLLSTLIVSNLSSFSYVSIYSTLTTYGNVYINNTLFVSSDSYFHSNVNISSLVPLSSVLYFQSSIVIGGNLLVGGSVNIFSSLISRSSIQVETLDITTSTNNITLTIASSFTTAGLLSTFGSMSTGYSTVVLQTAFFDQNVSSQTVGGNYTTGTIVNYADTIIRGNTITADVLNVRSTFFLDKNITVDSNIFISSSLHVGNNMSTYFLSTPSLSTNGSMTVHGSFNVVNEIIITSTLSTLYLQADADTYIDRKLNVSNAISTNGNVLIDGDLFALGFLNASSIYVKDNVGVGGNLVCGKNLLGNTILFNSNVNILGNIDVQGFVTMNSTLGVYQNVYVSSNLYARFGGAGSISSFHADRFLLSNLQITASSPDISLRVSSLQTSSLYTAASVFLDRELSISSLYASTIITSTLNTEILHVGNTGTAERFILGDVSQDFNYMFAINTPSYFIKGLSTQSIYGSTIYSGLFSGSHIGDASQLSNVQTPFYFISTVNLFASTITVENIYARTGTILSTFNVSTYLSVISSVLMPYLSINATGFSTTSTINNIVSLSPSTMVINRNIFFNALTNRIGFNVSSPNTALDINGSLFASNIVFSSINDLRLNTVNFIYSTLIASTSLVASTFAYGSTGIYIGEWIPGVGTGTSNYPMRIWNTETIPNCNYGIANLNQASTIILNNSLFINASTGFVGINTVQFRGTSNNAIPLQAQYPLDIRGALNTNIGFFSSMNYTQQMTTTMLQFFNFAIYGLSSPFSRAVGPAIGRIIPHSICTFTTSYVFDNIMQFDRRQFTGIGGTPTSALDVYFNTLFSSLNTNILRADSIGINYRDI